MKKILVVDDFASVRLYHANLLKRLGHMPVVAANGEEAFQVLRAERIDLVLLDMLMPKVDGCEFLQRMRAMPDYASVPVIVISSEGTSEHEERFRHAGASGFLKKPALPQVMVEMLKQYLG